MRSTAFSAPILPGMTDDTRLIFSESMGKRRAELADSCNRLGIAREFAWIQKEVGGDRLIVYLEAGDVEAAVRGWAGATTDYDLWLQKQLRYTTGIDFGDPRQAPPAPAETADFQVDAVAHAVPVADVSPVRPEKKARLREWFAELKGPRARETTAYLERAGLARQAWFLESTPAGDQLITFALAEDPREWRRGLAFSRHPFDRWLKSSLEELTGAAYDVQAGGMLPPAPKSELVLDWHHAFQAAA